MIGVDIVAISRIEGFIVKFGDKALDRFLDKGEQILCKKIESIAGFWAAKEAIAKALGTGIGEELGFDDISIYKDEKGAPKFRLKESLIGKYNIKETSLSISHDGGFAIAVAVIS